MQNRYSFIPLLVCVSLSLFAFSASAYAINRPGSLTLSFGGGNDYLAHKRNMRNQGLGFAALGYNFTEHWGIEGFLAGFNGHYKNFMQDDRSIDATLFALDGVYHFSINPIVEPYLEAGVGIIGMNPSKSDAHNEANLNAALGVQFFIDQMIAFRFEARDFYTMIGGKNDVVLTAGISLLVNLC